MPPFELNNGLLLRKSPYTRSMTVAALPDLAGVCTFTAPHVPGSAGSGRRWFFSQRLAVPHGEPSNPQEAKNSSATASTWESPPTRKS